jgi:hypothetical protein
MERVIETEFKKDFRGILMRAIASAAVKTAAQAVLSNDKNGDGGKLAAFLVAIYSATTTAADVRIWSALPKDFQVARCAIPSDNTLLIFPANPSFGNGPPSVGKGLFEVIIPPCRNAIVYIKIINAGATPVCEVMAF